MVNLDLQEMLTSRAESVEAPEFDAGAVVARGDRLVRRRRGLVTGGVALAVAGALGLAAVVSDPAERPLPTEPVPVPEWTPGTRPLTYGQGQTLHLGDREIDTGMDFLTIDLTDEGAALTTIDGGIWFTDGTSVERIGTTLGVCCIRSDGWSYFVGRPPEWVASASSGSLLAWMEFPDRRVDRPELVVYDSDTRAVLAREPIEVAERNSATIVDVVDGAVFVAEDDRGSFDSTPTFRYDIDTGVVDRVDDPDMEAARRDVVRALIIGPPSSGGLLLQSPERTSAATYTVQTVLVRDSTLERLFDPHTEDRVDMAVPEGYEGRDLYFTQWLDDDRFVLIASPGIRTGDLLVCRTSAGRCDAVLDDTTWTVAPLTPGDGLVGSELAIVGAVRAVETKR